jgi:hypothetical protein
LKKNNLFLSKIAIYLSLGLLKRRASYMRSLQPSKENTQHFKKLNLSTFFYFVGHFCPPKSRSVSGSRGPIESGSNLDDPDPQQLVAVKCGKPLLFLTTIKFENKDLPRVRRLEAL